MRKFSRRGRPFRLKRTLLKCRRPSLPRNILSGTSGLYPQYEKQIICSRVKVLLQNVMGASGKILKAPLKHDENSFYSDPKYHTSPVRNVIFNAGKTSRINVADFMSDLAVKSELWNEWKGKMPVIYDRV
ncbi:hypothetical protein BOV90_03935 [Solemya velum gill symbiont]|uniref:Uncharacterized protein n=1 Tax=Solemya velum gill symbiont TaxID=2340 RepID=A0A1T2CUP7_SOVGS|nr:hypothetical protein BOV88_04680 [Solemya velum gill symbiont]OOY38503.1 hypothetical protein BOV89_01490 [Solemya velum gill symbiont]OOY40457.1 hypothetical protein BOV90_03935 [Solemya velum gill symbiont]OOY45834.1 hypothetical protein BOV92_04255 [Solemya velum gill symbiont]OOY48883.1 hypothetical protein BOV93_00135 [Solemya velum gill symbiont]